MNEQTSVIKDRINEFIKKKSKTFQEIKISKELSQPIYPPKGFKKLNKECQRLAKIAENDSNAQNEIGIHLIEGKNGFPMNTELGITYLVHSIERGNINSVIYYCKMLVKVVKCNYT